MNDVYRKLVDLYAGEELPDELKDELEAAAFNDASLSHDMNTLKNTVALLKSLPDPHFTEESYHRILMKLYARGAYPQSTSPPSAHLQYHLPMVG